MKIKKSHYVWLLILIILPIIILSTNKIKLGLDLKGGTYVVLEAQGKIESDTMTKVREIVERRVNGLGVSEPVIQLSGTNRLIVELAGIKDPDKAVELIGTTAKLEFRLKNSDGTYGEPVLDGTAIVSAMKDTSSIKPAVTFKLNDEGSKVFAKVTKENIGRELAIMLDGKEQSAPEIQSEIPGGNGLITVGTAEEAESLANLLSSGALPVNIKIMETRTVGATLGSESIKQTQVAGIVAFALISLFMAFIYKIPGLIADVVLVIYGLLVLALFSLIGAVLTLPGIAGFILTLGMAVDANVITFERIKEELKKGRSLDDSIEYGFKNGLPAIIDGNLTTILVAIVLFFLGTGPVKGFAVTLILGTAVTLVTAVFIIKVLFILTVKTFKIKKERLFGKGVL